MRLSLISVLAMLEWLQFYFIPVAKMLAASFCLPGQRKKSPCAMNKGKMTPDIYFCYFYRRLQNKCKTPRRAWLADDADYTTESEFVEIHTRVEVVKAAGSKISRLSKPSGNHKTELHLLKKPTHQKCTLIKWTLFKAGLSHCQIRIEPFRKSDSSYWYQPLQNLLPFRKASPWIYCCRLEAGTKGN